MMNIFIILLLVLVLIALIRYVFFLRKRISELRFSIRSQSVKHGKNWENFVPFMNEFRKYADKNNFVFIGHPIDGIAFDDDAIKFIEIKTGKSSLSSKQRKIKEMIKQKKVKWIELVNFK